MPQDKNGRRHCYSCGHFIASRGISDSCRKCKEKHDDITNSGVRVCTCGRMFAGWTYLYQQKRNLRKAETHSAFDEHWKNMYGEGTNHDWCFVKHEDLTNAEILSGKVIVEGRFP